MRNRFDQQLHHLDEQLTHMGKLCEIAISKVTQALKEGSAGQARIVVAENDHRYGADRGSDFRYRRDHYFCKI